MGEVAAAAASGSCRHHFPRIFGAFRGSDRSPDRKKMMISGKKEQWHFRSLICSLPAESSRINSVVAGASSNNNSNADVDGVDSLPDAVTFSSSISTDIPLYESPGVSFDEYISDRPRVFLAMFPDKGRSKRLNNEEWRIQMLPLQFLFASVNPVVVMRLRHKSNGKEYPPVVPEHATSMLELQAIRWELRGLEGVYVPPHFALSVQGVLYPDRSNNGNRLKGHLQMSISMVLPPVLKLVPIHVLNGVADAVLSRLVEKMKSEVDIGLVADFGKFRTEKLMKRTPIQPPL